MLDEARLAKILALHERFVASRDRVLLNAQEIERLKSILPVLSPDLGELDLMRHKSALGKQRELADDFLEGSQALRQIADLSEPVVDELLAEAKRVGRP
jgi:hypothetical protein